MKRQIKFSENWNNKLDCFYFTTIRPAFPNYQIGHVYEVYLKGAYCYDAIILDIKILHTDQINKWHSLLDAGLGVQPLVNMIKKMYPNNDTWKLILFARECEHTIKN